MQSKNKIKQKQKQKSERERERETERKEKKETKRALLELASSTAGTKKHTSEHQLPAERYSYPHTDMIQKAEESLGVTAGSLVRSEEWS